MFKNNHDSLEKKIFLFIQNKIIIVVMGTLNPMFSDRSLASVNNLFQIKNLKKLFLFASGLIRKSYVYNFLKRQEYFFWNLTGANISSTFEIEKRKVILKNRVRMQGIILFSILKKSKVFYEFSRAVMVDLCASTHIHT